MLFMGKQGTERSKGTPTERLTTTNWTMLRSQNIVHLWLEQITLLSIVVTLPSVSRSWLVACLHHHDKTGKGFRDLQDTYDTNLVVYSGMHIRVL